ncbi:MAG TPA: ABC transporter permease subunit, partial [Pirellulales bacterium]|nr:ABC transporter permease subunit [Pirellulales bacterium]
SILASLLVVAVTASVFSWLSLRPGAESQRWFGRLSLACWLTSVVLLFLVLAEAPFFHGFFAARSAAGSPTYGKGGLIWASLTLALLTLPVVIVATEEALAAVPRSMREGSYACGAGKWQTIRRIVLPRAMPGIMTGMILAMARGAGEVAPLMLVGAAKLAPKLPLDGVPPYLHPQRSFMHLAFQVFDLGFQSPNSEAAKPMVFTTTLLLITIIALLNLAAIWLRTRLSRRFMTTHF